MHELSLCQDLIGQVTELANRHRASSVSSVRVQIGMLAGVEPLLLESAFTIARAGTIADRAEMITEMISPRVFCQVCGTESETSPSRLSCPACGSADTRLIRGEELILARVEMEVEDDTPPEPKPSSRN